MNHFTIHCEDPAGVRWIETINLNDVIRTRLNPHSLILGVVMREPFKEERIVPVETPGKKQPEMRKQTQEGYYIVSIHSPEQINAFMFALNGSVIDSMGLHQNCKDILAKQQAAKAAEAKPEDSLQPKMEPVTAE